MKKLSIIKNGQVVQFANFDNDQAIEDFKQVLAKGESWGKPERWLQDTPLTPLSEDEKKKAKEVRVREVLGENVTEYRFDAEYSIDIKDITTEVKTEKDKKDKKEKDKKDRVKSLKDIDWAKIKNFNDAIPILQALVAEQLKDEE